MTTQKIITLVIDQDDGAHALRQIREAAGPGSWRIVSLLDLHDTQGFRHWLPDRNLDHGRRVLVVLEQESKEAPVSQRSFVAVPEPV
jgi:hypothetical protein